MLTVDQYSYIRTAHRVYGKAIKQIARETGHSKIRLRRFFGGNTAVTKQGLGNHIRFWAPILKASTNG